MKNELNTVGAEVTTGVADVGNAQQLNQVIELLAKSAEGFDVVLYNAAAVKRKDIMDEKPEDLTRDFTINVVGAVQTMQSVYNGLKQKQGAFLVTGGGVALVPDASHGSLSIGKAALRNLTYQFHNRLKDEGIYVGYLL